MARPELGGLLAATPVGAAYTGIGTMLKFSNISLPPTSTGMAGPVAITGAYVPTPDNTRDSLGEPSGPTVDIRPKSISLAPSIPNFVSSTVSNIGSSASNLISKIKTGVSSVAGGVIDGIKNAVYDPEKGDDPRTVPSLRNTIASGTEQIINAGTSALIDRIKQKVAGQPKASADIAYTGPLVYPSSQGGTVKTEVSPSGTNLIERIFGGWFPQQETVKDPLIIRERAPDDVYPVTIPSSSTTTERIVDKGSDIPIWLIAVVGAAVALGALRR